MTTCSQSVQTPLPTETFEELIELSQIPQEDPFSRNSPFETQIAQILSKHMALQLYRDDLNERVKSLETSQANNTSPSAPKTASS